MQPQMVPLPDLRIPNTENFIFKISGDIFFGPFAIKPRDNMYLKRYACIFSCVTKRAGHLKRAYQLNTDSFIQAILRSSARQGNPRVIVSDKGRNFVGASRELVTNLNQFVSTNRKSVTDFWETTEWNFFLPYASHFGGAWERLVQSPIQILYSVIGFQILTEGDFHSFLTQVEKILNSRPLTYIPDNHLSYQPITQNNFLIGRLHKNLPSSMSITKDYNKDWKKCTTLSQQFWTRLLREFISTMARRSKWIKNQKPLEVGQLVWLLEDMTPRGIWAVGIEQKLVHRNDGKVRSCKTRTGLTRKTTKTSKQGGTSNWWLGKRPKLRSKTVTTFTTFNKSLNLFVLTTKPKRGGLLSTWSCLSKLPQNWLWWKLK